MDASLTMPVELAVVTAGEACRSPFCMNKERRTEVRKQPSIRIVVVGAGYAGLLSTMRLAGRVTGHDVAVALVNESDTFTERVRLHQYATNQPVQWRSLPRMLQKTPVAFVQGRAVHLDPGNRQLTVEGPLQPGLQLEYDYLVYALGSVTERRSVAGVAEYAYTLAPRGPLSAKALRRTLPEVASKGGRVVVSGGGATGIETAAEIATAYPSIKVHLVTRDQFALHFGEDVAGYIRRSLNRMGVEIIDQSAVTEVGPRSIVVDHQGELPCDICVWAAGFEALPLARDGGLEVNSRNQVIVDPFLRSMSHPEIYAIGDAASPREDPGFPVRMSAFTACILGAHGADTLSAAIAGGTPKALSFAYVGQGIALGRNNAVGFNSYPDDRAKSPIFTGRSAYLIREGFVRYLAAVPQLERRWPGSFVWIGKRRYAESSKLRQARQSKDLVQARGA
jgi:NADH dehydrogenase FAD-containing subunit